MASEDLVATGDRSVRCGFIVWQATREKTNGPVVYKTVARFATDELVEQVK